MTVKRLIAVVALSAVFVVAFATAAFATETSGVLSGPFNAMRASKVVEVVPGDSVVIDQVSGTKVSYLLVNTANEGVLAMAYNGNLTSPGYTGAVNDLLVWKNTTTATMYVRVQADYSSYTSMSATLTYSVPANVMPYATEWSSYSLPTVTVYPGRKYTCVRTSVPTLSDPVNFFVNGAFAGTVNSTKLGPIWSYTNSGPAPVTISMRDTLPWSSYNSTQFVSAGKLAGALYF